MEVTLKKLHHKFINKHIKTYMNIGGNGFTLCNNDMLNIVARYTDIVATIIKIIKFHNN